jgi:hypothetical protein
VDGRTLTVRAERGPVKGTPQELYLTFPGVSFVADPGAPPVAVDSPAGRAALRHRRWTLDVAAGAIIVDL